jgi:outer membrane protein OmpA-like peptidoglycan-associated protein
MRRLLLVTLACTNLAALAAGPAIPPYLGLPTLPVGNGEVEFESFGQHEFTVREKTEVHRGKYWAEYIDYAAKLGDDPRRALGVFVDAMQKAGWQVVLHDAPRNPPLATFHYAKNGKDAWAEVEIGEQAHVTVVESGAPSAKLDLPPPSGSMGKVAPNADFPLLKHYPGSKLSNTVDEDVPFMVAMDAEHEPVQVASGSTRKEYAGPDGLGRIEAVEVYAEALKRAGWTIVEEAAGVSQGDPNLTAHFVKGTTDLWVHVHARPGEGYNITVADAGAERSSSRLKSQLDRACKVPIYGLNFDFDKATLRADSEAALNAILQVLNDYPDLAVEIAGHTDNVGKPDYNTRLSEARVNTVRGWLVGKGVKADRLTAKGYGSAQAVATNDTPEGRAKNRRVELRKKGC